MPTPNHHSYSHLVAAFDEAAVSYLKARMKNRRAEPADAPVTEAEREAFSAMMRAFDGLVHYAVEAEMELDEPTLAVLEKDRSDIPPFALARALDILQGKAQAGTF